MSDESEATRLIRVDPRSALYPRPNMRTASSA